MRVRKGGRLEELGEEGRQSSKKALAGAWGQRFDLGPHVVTWEALRAKGWGRGQKEEEGPGEKEGEGRKELSTRMPGYFMLEAKVECAGHVSHCLRGPGGDCPLGDRGIGQRLRREKLWVSPPKRGQTPLLLSPLRSP